MKNPASTNGVDSLNSIDSDDSNLRKESPLNTSDENYSSSSNLNQSFRLINNCNTTNITPEDIIRHTESFFQNENENIYPENYFIAKPANMWIEEAKLRPIPNMLFSEFWYEGELCILFADTNLGKSILAVQIGNSICSGKPTVGFKQEAKMQGVLLFDFELSDKQFEIRYSNEFANHFIFDEKFMRVEINQDAPVPQDQTLEDYIISSLEQTIIQENIKVLIIDNITYLKNDNEKAKDALPLMKQLKALKKKYNLSILVIAHTPKRDLTKPITRNDLQGSKMLINFCDSAFAIGESNIDNTLRYIKQIKQRNTALMYGADNVCVCQLVKPSNFLMFEFIKCGKEWEHLKQHTENDIESLRQRVLELNQNGKSLRGIGLELGISYGKVHRILNDNKKS